MIDWVAYNRSIGFDDILIYTNDCDDGTDTIAERMQELGWAHHERNPVGRKEKPQTVAFSQARNHASYQASDWILSLDVDEYINVRVPGGDIRSFVDASGDADAISMCWLMFGQGGKPNSLTAPFPRRSFAQHPKINTPISGRKGSRRCFATTANSTASAPTDPGLTQITHLIPTHHTKMSSGVILAATCFLPIR